MRMNVAESFEESFTEKTFYNKQTQDETHLRDILKFVEIEPGMKVLDLGCGSKKRLFIKP